MDITPVTSSPSIHVQNFNRKHESHRSASKSAAMPYQKTRGAISIPNSRGEPPPPPLPPPTQMANITAGSDPGHFWGNKFGGGSFGARGGSISSESSLPRGWHQEREDDGGTERLDYSRRGSSQSVIRSPSEMDTKHDFSRQNDEGFHSLSGPSPANYQLVYKIPITHPLNPSAPTPENQCYSSMEFTFSIVAARVKALFTHGSYEIQTTD